MGGDGKRREENEGGDQGCIKVLTLVPQVKHLCLGPCGKKGKA